MKNILLKFIFLILFIPIFSSLTRKPDIDSFVQSIVHHISNDIIDRTRRITNYPNITADFEKLNSEKELIIKKAKGEKIIKRFTEEIEETFRAKTEALKKIKQKAEEEKKKYTGKDNKKCDYLNMHTINASDPYLMKIYPPFSKTIKVNISRSFVHVPTNVYACRSDILDAVEWTRGLDETFTQNYNESNGTILYQYYGDQTGKKLTCFEM